MTLFDLNGRNQLFIASFLNTKNGELSCLTDDLPTKGLMLLKNFNYELTWPAKLGMKALLIV